MVNAWLIYGSYMDNVVDISSEWLKMNIYIYTYIYIYTHILEVSINGG